MSEMRTGGLRVLIIGLLAGFVWYGTAPGDKDIDYRTCEPRFGLPQISASLYGKSFWQHAAETARNDIARSQTNEAQFQEMFESVRRSGRERLSKMEEIGAMYRHPTPAEVEAEDLRTRASELELQETMAKMSTMRTSGIEAIKHCEAIIVSRLQKQ